jgi:hypothetical protein
VAPAPTSAACRRPTSEAKTALRKLVRALPQTFRADAEAAASATMIDPTRWGERDRRRPDMVGLLQAAVIRRRKIRLTYTNRTHEPHGSVPSSPTTTPAGPDTELSGDLDTAPESIIALATRGAVGDGDVTGGV